MTLGRAHEIGCHAQAVMLIGQGAIGAGVVYSIPELNDGPALQGIRLIECWTDGLLPSVTDRKALYGAWIAEESGRENDHRALTLTHPDHEVVS